MKKEKLRVSKIQSNIVASFMILFGLILVFIVFRKLLNWPGVDTEKTVLTGIFIFSLLPFILNLVDLIIKRGGKIEFGNLKIDFSKVQGQDISRITVPANIGVRGQSVADSGTVNILDALRQATSNSIVIIDLEDGQAWWETRLLVLLSGAQRLGCPDKIVFIADKSNKQQCFIAWAYPKDLLKCLLKAHPKYIRAYYVAKAVSSQWNSVEPLYPGPNQNVLIPPTLSWMQSEATHKSWMAFDGNTGLPNELFEEQVLQNELGREVENQEGGKYINMGRINDLFMPILNMNHIDQNEPSEKQLRDFFADDVSFIAMTQDGRYSSLISRSTIYNEILKRLSCQND